jgi:hypothetical protein
MKATADQLNAWAGQYDEHAVPGSIVLPAARWWDVQGALQQLAALRSKPAGANEIVAAVCAQHENPYLSARDPHVLQAFDEVLGAFQREPVAPAAPPKEAPRPVATAPLPAPPAPQAQKENESISNV